MSIQPDETDVDMGPALDLLEECRVIIEKLDGIKPNQDGDTNKDRMRRNAERSRLLLFAAHIADGARYEITSQYHRFKGERPPTVNL